MKCSQYTLMGVDISSCMHRNLMIQHKLYNPKLEAGSGLGQDQKQSRPADILVNNWGFNGKPAAFDLSVSSLTYM